MYTLIKNKLKSKLIVNNLSIFPLNEQRIIHKY